MPAPEIDTGIRPEGRHRSRRAAGARVVEKRACPDRIGARV